jgi:gamma-glutamylcysteine synthetase
MKELIDKYIEIFNEEPIIIGMFWNDLERIEQNITNAIKTGKKYNELEMLTDEQRKLFNKGKLLF